MCILKNTIAYHQHICSDGMFQVCEIDQSLQSVCLDVIRKWVVKCNTLHILLQFAILEWIKFINTSFHSGQSGVCDAIQHIIE